MKIIKAVHQATQLEEVAIGRDTEAATIT